MSPFKEMAEDQDTDDFYFENADDFELLFSERTDAVLKYVKTGAYEGSPVDYIYLCVDPFSLPAILEQARAFNAETSDSILNIYDSLNQLVGALRRLNLALKLHGGILFGVGADGDYYALLDNTDDLDANIPGYAYNSLAIVDQSTIYCEVDGGDGGGDTGGDTGGGDTGGGDTGGDTPPTGYTTGYTVDEGCENSTGDSPIPDVPDCCLPVDNNLECWEYYWYWYFYENGQGSVPPPTLPTTWPYTRP